MTAVATVRSTRHRDLRDAERIVMSMTYSGERSELVVLSAELVALVLELCDQLDVDAPVDLDDDRIEDLDAGGPIWFDQPGGAGIVPLDVTDLSGELLRELLVARACQR